MREELREDLKEEVVVEETKTTKTKKGGKLKKVIATGLVLVTIGVGGTLLYLNIDNQTPKFTQTTTTIVNSVESASVIDDIIADETIADLDELAVKVDLSEQLHDLNLEQYIGGLDKLEMPESYTIEGVSTMIDTFNTLLENEKVKNGVLSKEDREFTKLALTLEAYERAVNGSLTNDAYKTLVNYGIPVVKGKVLDACGFEASEVSNLKIGSGAKSYVITFDDPTTGKTYNVEAAKGNAFTSKGYVSEVIGDIYDWQSKSSKAQDTGTSYDGERNKDILEGINTLKAITLMDCTITNNGKVEVTSSMKEVRAKEKALTQPEKSK